MVRAGTALARCYLVVVTTSSAFDDTRLGLSGNGGSAERNARYVRRYQDE